MKLKRPTIVLTGVAACALLLAGCGSDKPAPGSDARVESIPVATMAAMAPAGVTPSPTPARATPAATRAASRPAATAGRSAGASSTVAGAGSGAIAPSSAGATAGGGLFGGLAGGGLAGLFSMGGGRSATGNDPHPAPGASAPAGQGATSRATVLAAPDSFRFRMTAVIESSCVKPGGCDAAGMESPRLSNDGGFNVALEGAYVAPDRFRVAIKGKMDNEQVDVEFTKIGADCWTTGGQANGPLIRDLMPVCGGTFDPREMIGGMAARDFADFDFVSANESVNGQATRHYAMSQDLFQMLAGLAADNETAKAELNDASFVFTIHTWVAHQNDWTVKATMDMTSSFEGQRGVVGFSWDMTDINSKNIVIKAP